MLLSPAEIAVCGGFGGFGGLDEDLGSNIFIKGPKRGVERRKRKFPRGLEIAFQPSKPSTRSEQVVKLLAQIDCSAIGENT